MQRACSPGRNKFNNVVSRATLESFLLLMHRRQSCSLQECGADSWVEFLSAGHFRWDDLAQVERKMVNIIMREHVSLLGKE